MTFTMVMSEFELTRCLNKLDEFINKHRPPASIRDQVDMIYQLKKGSVEIIEIRNRYANITEKLVVPIAKAIYVKPQKSWEIYVKKADSKWHLYEPKPTVKFLEEFLGIVAENKSGCFFK